MTQQRRVGALAAVVVATMAAWTAAATAEPTPSPSPSTPSQPVAVTLSGVSPLAPQPGDRLTLTGTLTEQAGSPVTNISVQLAVSRSKVGNRGEFDGFASTPDGPPPTDALVPATETTDLGRTDLGIGDTEAFSVSVPVDDLQLPEAWQVYEMTVVVTGDTVTGRTTVGQLRTFLPWAPIGVPGVGLPTKLAWVWPIVDRPHRSDTGGWIDDDLAASMTGGGRLFRLVAAGSAAERPPPPPAPKVRHPKRKHSPPTPPAPPRPTIQPVPVTWAIDPQIVDDATAMTRPYRVAGTDGPRAGRGGAAARAWLASLQQGVNSGQVFALPYADPDVVAATRSGLGTEVQLANRIGDTLIQDTLHRTPLPYVWPPNGLIDQRTLDAMFAAGETTVVLDSTAVPIVGGPPSETPGARTTIKSRDFPFNALLADHTLNDVVDAGARTDDAGPLAVQRLLSELLMIQAERPSDQRSLVITPSRRWAPTAAYAATVLSDTGRVPWIDPVSLSDVAAGPVYDAVQRPRLVFTNDDRDLLLHRGYLDRVAHLRRQIDAFAAIVPPGDAVARGFDDGLRRLLSSAWRAAPATARDLREDLAATVNHTMDRVRIASRKGSLVTLTSHTGTVPVTVTNDLDSPVRIVVEIEPDQHLVVRSGRAVRTIAAHRQVPVDVRATAQTSGVFTLTVRLATPPPLSRHYGPAVPLRIRSTAYGSTALLITGGATGVLLLTVVVRLVRRARSARRSVRTST